MYDCFMMVFTAMSGIGAFAAVIVAIIIYNRQKKIALFERRSQILNDFEHFTYLILPNWDWDGSISVITKYSEKEIEALFDREIVNLQKDILKAAELCNILLGDIDYAQNHGTCHNKTESELEAEKLEIEKKIGEELTSKRSDAYRKWLNI